MAVTITSPASGATVDVAVAVTATTDVKRFDTATVTADGVQVGGPDPTLPISFQVSLEPGLHVLAVHVRYRTAAGVKRWQHSVDVPVTVQAATTPEPTPSGGCYWGARMDGDVYGGGDAPWDQNTWNTFESHAGKKVALVSWGQQWGLFDATAATQAHSRGAINQLDMYTTGGHSLAEIAAGGQDAAIDAFAAKVKAFGKPILFRPWHEMNGSWTQSNFQPFTAAEYVAAWQHFRHRCDLVGAINLTWVWCPNVWSGSSTGSVKDPRLFYPSSEYVDWVGLDGYNFGGQSFTQVYAYSLGMLPGYAAGKPVAICEIACVETSTKAAWIRDMLDVRLPAWPEVKSFSWFNWNYVDTKTGQRVTWPIESSAAAQQAFHDSIQNARYLSAPAAGFGFGKVPTP